MNLSQFISNLRSDNMSVTDMIPLVFATVLIGTVQGDSLLTPCRPDDVECLSKSTSQFLSNTCKGMPDYDIRAIDPMVISSTDFKSQEFIYHFKNLEITGLKNQQFSNFKMNTINQEVVLSTKANISVAGELTLEVINTSKTFSGTFTQKGSVIGTAIYNYSFRTDDKGVKYYEVEPEKNTCEVLGEAELTFGQTLKEAVMKDYELAAYIQQNKDKILTLRKKVLCHIAVKAYETVIHNIRAAAKILPASSFLVGV